MVIANHRLGLVAEPSNRTEDPAMTDEMMTLRTLLEKSSDTDLLREMIGCCTAMNGIWPSLMASQGHEVIRCVTTRRP